MTLNLRRIGLVVERYMVDTVTVWRPEPEADTTLDPLTLELLETRKVVYTGKAMVAALGSPGLLEVGNMNLARVTYEVALPYPADGILPGDWVQVDSSNDVGLAGKTLRVQGVIPTSLVTHRRLTCYMDVAA